MKQALVDSNVILDVLRDRKPHAQASAAVWVAVETGVLKGLLAAHAVTTIHYLVRKELGATRAKQIISELLSVFGVASIDGTVIRQALELSLPDFEDAVTAAAARLAGCDCIVTRDPRGFRGSPVRSIAPEAAIPLWDDALE